ncbi:putative RNA helicase putativemitochondrial [Leptomonas pyrrhocoris]|uniref:RNA helicase n=1 Tax=Leptomonas pyrrhocoris TaxID=157538 RepID=A0A0N0VFZ2_LEPPY|nr:putative RNA helicase putativemitochondrial [Leptomonas pyrrhocoris]KPA82334.1 putative RNA helicase putativemitochondrial [Leptomonas pyrrhocoris]|eukprot:XP_015660773.1 putative RNA helicase putativemitochondrial [Leptomonas pyrrhocoris]
MRRVARWGRHPCDASAACPLPRFFPRRRVSTRDGPASFPSTTKPPLASRQDRLHVVCNAIYRSATAREALRQAIHEPSHENALRLLGEFEGDAGVWRDAAWAAAFDAAAPQLSAQIRLVLTRVTQWHTVRKAPTKVAMHAPWEWYPQARLTRRTFIFHHGPTNSGKTHAALEAMMAARSGVYCAPLKALAAQVWHRVNDRVPCDLLIGDERVFGGAAEHVSCTVEMTPIDLTVDVAVIDEVQMLADRDRGWAWTRALLGIPAREVHLCGEKRALPLVQRLLHATHERQRLACVEHTRLVPLTVSPSLSGSLRETVENGDCFVCFSKKKVLDMRDRLNRIPGVTSSAIYGAMPFQVREAEAARFNRGVAAYVRQTSDTAAANCTAAGARTPKHALVSTDAIAYGLNMNIERMIFTALRKFDGTAMVDVPAATVQQIAGRSGRFGRARQHDVGRCTVMDERDMRRFQEAMTATLPPLEKAGLLPTADILQLYVELESTRARKNGEEMNDSFSDLMSKFAATCMASSLFFACAMERSLLRIAKLLEPVRDLALVDRIVFCYLPLSDDSPEALQLVVAYAEDHAKEIPVRLRIDAACDALLQRLRQSKNEDGHHHGTARPPSPPSSSSVPQRREDVAQLERMFRLAEMYCWLSWRFGKTFLDREKGLALKASIADALTRLNGN